LKLAVAKLSPIPRTIAFVKALAEVVVLAKKIVPDVALSVTLQLLMIISSKHKPDS